MKFIYHLLLMLFLLRQVAFSAIPPVSECMGAYNNLFKNRHESLYKNRKNKNSKITEQKSKVVYKFEKNISIEEFKSKLDTVAVSISRLKLIYKSSYEKLELQEIKNFIEALVSKYYKQSFDVISQTEVNQLDEYFISVNHLLKRANIESIISK